MKKKPSAQISFRLQRNFASGFPGRSLLGRWKFSICILAALALAITSALAQISPAPFPGPKPRDVESDWKRMVGDYESRGSVVTLFERGGLLYLSGRQFGEVSFKLDITKSYVAEAGVDFAFAIDTGRSEIREVRGDTVSETVRLDYEPHPNKTWKSSPQEEVQKLRREALAAPPPNEKGPFRQSELLELAPLDSAIRLDIRYATANDFLGTPVYTQARAFLQRPAAEALLRALHRLQPLRYGLLIHDAYRPWYVTKIFWDATPQEGKIFVADPAQGSRHNRGCAVDLTLYDLRTGRPIEMTGRYDEMSPRSYPNYPGGTSLQRWHRDLLRWAMESEGFTVYEYEWWHFDYKDWREYAIGNIPFEKLDVAAN